MSEWRELPLGEVATLQRGFDLPERNRKPGNVPVVSSSGISGTHNVVKVRGPGVVTGRYGTLGRVFYIEQDFWPHNTTLFVKDFHGNEPRFVYYLLSGLNLAQQSAVSAVPGINRNDLHRIPVLLPPLPVQRRIAQILGRLDDKIEVNRRINRTLEAMARALYRHWFVDFGPFQDGEFVESELGLIPKGWKVKTVYSLANYVNGMAFKPKDLSSDPQDGLPVIKISELNRGFPNSTTRYYSGEYKSKYELATGDVLFAWSASLGIYLWTQGKALLNQHIFNVRPNGSLSKATLYFLLKHVIDEFVAIAAARRTTMGHIKKSHLQEKLVAIPPQKVLEQITPKFDRLFQMILTSEIETAKLAATRDYLLPRLLSGEVVIDEHSFH